MQGDRYEKRCRAAILAVFNVGHIPFLFTLIFIQNGIFQRWGFKGVFLITILFFLSCGGIFIYMKKKIQQYYHLKEAKRVSELIRNQRHDWMNHVQVIMGYQMLKKSEKIDQYLHKLIQIAKEERMISDLAYPPLAARLLTINYDYSQWNWRVRRKDSVDSLTVEQQKQLDQMLEQLLSWLTQRITPQTIWTDIECELSYKEDALFFTFHFLSTQTESDQTVVHPMDWGQFPKKLVRQKASYQWFEKEHRLLVKIPITDSLSRLQRRGEIRCL